MKDQRNFRRINFQTVADINIGGEHYKCDLIDLALQGALFRSLPSLPVEIGEKAVLSIFLPESSLRLNFTGELIHRRGDFYGFIFVSEDDETMGHLRRLLELNFGSSEEVEQEFATWLKKAEH